MPYDLFGEIPVTEDEIFEYVRAVAPRWLSPRRSFDGYVRSYNVAGKVRMMKASGLWHTILDAAPQPWHARLALAAIV